MKTKQIFPTQAKPVQRTEAGRLPAELAELNEEVLSSDSGVVASTPILWLKGLPCCAHGGNED